MKQTRCPACGRNTVRLYLRANGEDFYGCTYRDRGCAFWFFAAGHDPDDRANAARWRAANPQEHREETK